VGAFGPIHGLAVASAGIGVWNRPMTAKITTIARTTRTQSQAKEEK
jgi:hypothetical protein